MTTPESIVTSLDWSRKLKGAGFNPWPLHEWFVGPVGPPLVIESQYNGDTRSYPAPTAEEILRRLPPFIIDGKRNGDTVTYDLHVQAVSGMEAMSGAKWKLWYFRVRDGIELAPLGNYSYADSLANAAAAMYCYLAEQKLLPSE